MTFVTEAGKQLLVGWVNQLNTPMYTPLNITAKVKGTAAAPPGMNGAAFAVVITQQPDNADDLALETLWSFQHLISKIIDLFEGF